MLYEDICVNGGHKGSKKMKADFSRQLMIDDFEVTEEVKKNGVKCSTTIDVWGYFVLLIMEEGSRVKTEGETLEEQTFVPLPNLTAILFVWTWGYIPDRHPPPITSHHHLPHSPHNLRCQPWCCGSSFPRPTPSSTRPCAWTPTSQQLRLWST